MEDTDEERAALFRQNRSDYHRRYSGRYLGPGRILMKFNNFNPLKDPRIEASKYEDSFPDVGRAEMERRFSERRNLFLATYDHHQPGPSLTQYINAARQQEGYSYTFEVTTGLASLFLGGSVPAGHREKGTLPECQLLGFIDGKNRVGCLAHPLAETSHGYDGRDRVGFFQHTGCCDSAGCEASREFRFLSSSAMEVFDKAVDGMSWYEYSRHATSVLVYYLRSYDHLLQRLDERGRLDTPILDRLVAFTNAFYDGWPLRQPSLACDSDRMSSLEILSTSIPVSERIMYLALNTCFLRDRFEAQLRQARNHITRALDDFCVGTSVP